MRLLHRIAALSLLLLAPLHAMADTGLEVIESLTNCDGRFFRALRVDEARWRNESSLFRRGGLAGIMVLNRRPPAPYAIEATEARFARPKLINGLGIISFFDGNLSDWQFFADNNIQFESWGFYVRQKPQEVMLWLSRNLPNVALQLAKPKPGTPAGVYCKVDAWQDDAWVATDEPCDTGLPANPEPRRVFAVRTAPFEHAGSVMGCEVFGALTPEIMNPLRPDLLR